MNNALFKDLIIFELANNHQGNMEHAKTIIRTLAQESAKRKINAAIKFQYRQLDTFIHPAFRNRQDVKHIPRFLATQLSADSFRELVLMVKDYGLKAACTPFDEPSVALCMDQGMDIIKIASCSANDWPLLEAAAKTKKPIVISTGGQTFAGIDNLYSFFTHRNVNFALLHCVGIYPPLPSQIQLSCIDKMIMRYPNIPIGYSGHEDPNNYIISQMAVAKGASILERHVGHAAQGIALNAYSTEIDEIGSWLDAVQLAKDICENGKAKRIDESEQRSLAELARGVFLSRAVEAGEKLTRNDVYFAMPAQDKKMKSGQFEPGIIATKKYDANDALDISATKSVIKDTRTILHEVTGMLNEAKIATGNKFTLELSHHYGLEHFRHHGATIINIINREYCKKLIVVLPGQKHPNHYHVKKEETFQVLSGTLLLTIDGKELTIGSGEIYTVERNMPHAFESVDGCIFEEISTTHIKSDSYYEDDSISALDPIQRKTILES